MSGTYTLFVWRKTPGWPEDWVKNCPPFEKTSQNSRQAKKAQNIFLKAQFENSKVLQNLKSSPNCKILPNMVTLINARVMLPFSGQFLIRHNAKTGAFVHILESIGASEKTGKTFDLKATYNASCPHEVQAINY